MPYTAKNYDTLLGTPGFSDQILKNHFTLYQGYVTNVNKLSDLLSDLLKNDKAGTPEFAETKRRFGWEFDGMRLHEYYFGNLVNGGKILSEKSTLAQKLIASFGSLETWEKEFKAVASMRGIGWAVLYYDAEADRVFNVWINEHDTGHFAGCTPLLVCDVFEHAFMLDYGTKRADYIAAFMKAVNWEVAEQRLTV